MFAALNTVEPPIVELSMAHVLERKEPWYEARLPMLQERVRTRLRQLSERLGTAEWLDGGFSAGDLMMIGVLLRLGGHGLLEEFPNVAAYVARGEARPPTGVLSRPSARSSRPAPRASPPAPVAAAVRRCRPA